MDQETLRGQVSEYRIYELIASGGFGSVYIGRDTGSNVPVAVKRMHAHLKTQPGFVERFEQEASTVRGLTHPNIVRLLDQGRDQGGVPFIVMEWVEGLTLGDWLKKHGRYTSAEAAEVGCQALEGLNAAWSRRVVHRDIKPANLMLTPGGRVKIMDFGVAKELDLATLAGSSGLIGTPAYMAPEQLRGQPLDCRADMYALAVTLFMMLAGRAPFEGPSFADYFRQHLEQAPPHLADVAPGVDAGLAEVLARALAKLPQDRFATPAEMLAAMRPYTEESTRLVAPADLEQTGFSDRLPPLTPMPRTSIGSAPSQAAAAVATPQPVAQTMLTPSWSRLQQQSQPQALPGDLFTQSEQSPGGRATPAVAEPSGSARFPLWIVAVPLLLLFLVVVGVLLVVLRPNPVADVRPTLIPAAPSVATQEPGATPQPSGPLFADNLDDLSKGKLLKASTNPSAYFVGYGPDYTIHKLTPNVASVISVSVPGSFVDTDTAVDARIAGPADNRFVSLNCRDQGSANSGYQMRVFPSSGLVAVARIDAGAPTTLAGPLSANTLKRGEELNRIELVCRGASIVARINGADVATVQDIAYRDGGVLIGAGADTTGGVPTTVEAHFKNLVVSNP